MSQHYSIILIMNLCFAVPVIAAYVHSSMTVVTFITYVFIVICIDILTNIHRHE